MKWGLWWLLVVSVSAWSEAPVSKNRQGVAAGGHDVTVYQQLERGGKAVKGDKLYVVNWRGAQWRFVREEDSQRFAADPEKFAPAYNGHCANALSLDEGLIKTNGKHWAIFDDQLYLFYAARGAKRWLEGDYQVYKQEADRAWQQLTTH